MLIIGCDFHTRYQQIAMAVTYSWNAESQITSTAGLTYLYDGDGRRVSKTLGASSRLYWYGSGNEVLAETDAAGNTTNEYIFFGGQRIADVPVGSTPVYYVSDMLNTSRVVTTNTGVVCYDADFTPYGGEGAWTDNCPERYRFEGKERDAETINDYFGARYYTERFGRWLSADWSSVPVPVPYANLTNPQTLNLYSMVADDPESFADLDGHDPNGNNNPPSQGGVSCTQASDFGSCSEQLKEEARVAENAKLAEDQKPQPAQQPQNKNNNIDNEKVGKTTVGSLEKTMSNEDRSLSTPKGGDPSELAKGKEALANAIINNAERDQPNQVAPATGTATSQDAQIMRDAYTSRANGGADPVQGRTYYGTSHYANLHSRSASNNLKGKAGRETVYKKFGPFKDSTSRRPTYIYIYNDPGH